MNVNVLKSAVAALILAGSAPAFASLIQVPGTQVSGTGLGAVSTLVTIQDNTVPSGHTSNLESGCVSYAGNLRKPSFDCQAGLEGGDNQAINRLYLASAIDRLTRAGELAVVVNISENTPQETAMLTHLYLSLYNLDRSVQMNFAYAGEPLELGDKGGIGQSGDNLFILDAIQAAQATDFCPDLSRCVIGGGMQFARGTTQATPETMYVAAYARTPDLPPDTPPDTPPSGTPVPEPFSLALLGVGLLGLGAARSRRA